MKFPEYVDDEPLSFEGSDDEEPERRADASHDHASDDNDDDADLASNHLVSDDQDDNTRTSDSESDDDAHVERLRNDLASVPFEKLVEIREKMGTKEFERDVMGTRAMKRKARGDQDANGDREEKAMRFEKQKRANKNRPMEVTSKRPVGRKRQVVEVPTRHARDPRFDPLSGQLRAEHFKTAYSFLDDYRQDEIKILAEEVRNTRDPEERMRLQDLLSKMRAQDRIKKRDDEHEALKRDWRKKELDLVKQGKKPYYLKKTDEKKLDLIQTFKELEAKGQTDRIDKIMEKRRMRNATKDHIKLPKRRMHG